MSAAEKATDLGLRCWVLGALRPDEFTFDKVTGLTIKNGTGSITYTPQELKEDGHSGLWKALLRKANREAKRKRSQ